MRFILKEEAPEHAQNCNTKNKNYYFWATHSFPEVSFLVKRNLYIFLYFG